MQVGGRGSGALATTLGPRSCAGGTGTGSSSIAPTLEADEVALEGFSEAHREERWETSAEALIALATALALNPVLSILRLGGNSLGAEGIALLAPALLTPHCALSELSLPLNGLRAEGAEVLAVPVASSASLRALDLTANDVGDQGVTALATALIEVTPPAQLAPASLPPADASLVHAGLAELNLCRNGLTGSCTLALARALVRRPHLTCLQLGWNELCDAGAAGLAGALADGCGLRELGLGHNRIGDAGAAALGTALARGRSQLQRLDLGHNAIGDEGATKLAEGLSAGGPPLQVLRLHWNKLGEQAGRALGTALGKLRTLRTLELNNNTLGSRAADALLAGVLANVHSGCSQLTHLGLECNVLPYPTLLKIQQAIAGGVKRAKAGRSALAFSRLEVLQEMPQQLEAAKREYAALCRQRAEAQQRVRALTTALDDEKASTDEARVHALETALADKQRVDRARVALQQLQAALKEKREQWAMQLEQRRKRCALETARVTNLEERFAGELRQLQLDVRIATDTLIGLAEQLQARAARADEREAALIEARAKLNARREELEGRRVPLPPPPPPPTDADVDAVMLTSPRLFPEDEIAALMAEPPSPGRARPSSARPAAPAVARPPRPQSATTRS